MRINEKITVNPPSSIDVNLKDSKNQLKNISVIITIIVSLSLLFVNWRVSEHSKKVEETKQLNNYLDKLNELIVEEKEQEDKKIELTVELIHDVLSYSPSFAFNLEKIKEIDYLTRHIQEI